MPLNAGRVHHGARSQGNSPVNAKRKPDAGSGVAGGGVRKTQHAGSGWRRHANPKRLAERLKNYFANRENDVNKFMHDIVHGNVIPEMRKYRDALQNQAAAEGKGAAGRPGGRQAERSRVTGKNQAEPDTAARTQHEDGKAKADPAPEKSPEQKAREEMYEQQLQSVEWEKRSMVMQAVSQIILNALRWIVQTLTMPR